MLLGMIAAGESVGVRALAALDVDPAELRQSVLARLAPAAS